MPRAATISEPGIRLIAARDHARPAAVLALLMILSGLTEGIGIVLLVPLLGVVSGAGLGGSLARGKIAHALAALGLPLQVAPLLAVFVALIAARAAINYARGLAAQTFEAGVVDGLRDRAWRALLACDWRELMSMRAADNASLLITTFDRIGAGLDQAIAALAAAVTLAAVAAAAWVLSPALTLAAMASGAIVLLLYRQIRRHALRFGAALDSAHRGIHGEVSEGLGALRMIKSLGREAEAARYNADAFAALRRVERHWLQRASLGEAALESGGAVGLAMLVWLAIARWQVPAITLLPMVALFARALPLLGAVQTHWQNWAYARPALVAAADLIGRAEAAGECNDTGADAPQLTRAITLRRVSVRFAADAPPALDDVSITIGACETVLITGASGAGKSTLADLIGGLLSPDSGEVSVDDVVLVSGARRAWRHRVAYVQQEPLLLAASLRENLLWAAPGADNARLQAALAAASASFVGDWPQGLDTRIGEGGRRLSGGERQRIVLARALLRDPALLILDEATNALDAANEALIVAALARLKNSRAIVIIGHSGSLAELADRTVTLDAGRIAQGNAPPPTVPGDSSLAIHKICR